MKPSIDPSLIHMLPSRSAALDRSASRRYTTVRLFFVELGFHDERTIVREAYMQLIGCAGLRALQRYIEQVEAMHREAFVFNIVIECSLLENGLERDLNIDQHMYRRRHGSDPQRHSSFGAFQES